MYIIYQITNIVNNKFYIGSTKNLRRRKNNHFNLLRKNKHHSRYLQNSWNKYGEENFIFTVLQNIEDATKVFEIENEFISKLKPEYNMMKNVFSHIGMKRSKETCEKISKALTGKKILDETKEKLRLYNLGKKRTPESIKKGGEASQKAWDIKNNYPIIAIDKITLEVYKEYSNIKEAILDLKCKRSCIIAVLNNHKNKKSYKGYIWKRK